MSSSVYKGVACFDFKKTDKITCISFVCPTRSQFINTCRDFTIIVTFVLCFFIVKFINPLNLRLLMSCIYMEHLFLMFLDHTQRRTTVGRTPLDE
jgi:hypothetical protein